MKDVLEEVGNVSLFTDEGEYTPHDLTIFSFQNFEIMMAKKNLHVEAGGLHL